MFVNLSLNSTDAVNVYDGKRKRFMFDTPLSKVSRIHLTSFELMGGNNLITKNHYLYFSEDWGDSLPFFRCVVPPGKYDVQSLCLVINNSLSCSKCLNVDSVVSSNTYSVFVCEYTGKLMFRSSGQCGYNLHSNRSQFQSVVINVHRNTPCVDLYLYSTVSLPLSRGALLTVYNVDVPLVTAQVVEVLDSEKVRVLFPGNIPSNIVVDTRLSVCPVSSQSSVHNILGFENFDSSPDNWILVDSAGIYSGNDSDGNTITFNSSVPSGAQVGDTVMLLEKSGVHLTGTVMSVPDHIHIVVKLLHTHSLSLTSIVSQLVQFKISSSSGKGIISRSDFVVDVTRNQRVAFLKLWLGTVEVGGTIVPRKNNSLTLFGRVQLRQQHDGISFTGNGDCSAIGSYTFDPCLQKVPFIDVEILDARGERYQIDYIGEWSLIVRCQLNESL
jgi:hypothetical protein